MPDDFADVDAVVLKPRGSNGDDCRYVLSRFATLDEQRSEGPDDGRLARGEFGSIRPNRHAPRVPRPAGHVVGDLAGGLSRLASAQVCSSRRRAAVLGMRPTSLCVEPLALLRHGQAIAFGRFVSQGLDAASRRGDPHLPLELG